MARRSGRTPFDETPIGRRLVSTFVVIILGAMLLSATPSSALTDLVNPWRRPITDPSGLFQSWNLFAPNPNPTTRRLEARLTYDDGTEAVWSPPDDPILGVYRSFRWRKWAGRVMSDDHTWLRAPAARYIASRTHRESGHPVRIVLVEQTYRAPPAGSGERRDPDPVWEDEILSTHRYSPDGRVLEDEVVDP